MNKIFTPHSDSFHPDGSSSDESGLGQGVESCGPPHHQMSLGAPQRPLASEPNGPDGLILVNAAGMAPKPLDADDAARAKPLQLALAGAAKEGALEGAKAVAPLTAGTSLCAVG